MPDEEREEPREEEEEDDLETRFPAVPQMPGVPEPPTLAPKLPHHPANPKPGSVAPGSYNKMAIATTAASSFIMPIIVLSVGGYFLDRALHHETFWFAFIGVLVGLIVGVVALLGVVNRLQD